MAGICWHAGVKPEVCVCEPGDAQDYAVQRRKKRKKKGMLHGWLYLPVRANAEAGIAEHRAVPERSMSPWDAVWAHRAPAAEPGCIPCLSAHKYLGV